MITKSAENQPNYARVMVPFQSARVAFGAILRAVMSSRGRVLLPAYIGWSPREGSGVFDPVHALRLNYSFYALDERLHIDLRSLQSEMERGGVSLLVLIHYFGFVDPSYKDVVKLARAHGIFVLEDEAHAMLSDVVGGICGRLGDASIFSFHKMLPVASGGAAVVNNAESPLAKKLIADDSYTVPMSNYDLLRIAERRCANALALHRMLHDSVKDVVPLWSAADPRTVPQSYPVLIQRGSRDRIYHEMNAAGYGVVSLYHTLVSQITSESFPATTKISQNILNLPVHQDVPESELEPMVQELFRLVRSD